MLITSCAATPSRRRAQPSAREPLARQPAGRFDSAPVAISGTHSPAVVHESSVDLYARRQLVPRPDRRVPPAGPPAAGPLPGPTGGYRGRRRTGRVRQPGPGDRLNRGVLRRGARRGLCRRDGTRPGEVQGIAVAAAGPHPVTPGLVTGVAIWLVLTSRHDLGPREELKREATGADRSP